MHGLAIKHNIEVAHRLSLLPGKCEAIHGHSMNVILTVRGGQLDSNGIMSGLNFTDMKKAFRNYLDTEYDHRLLLNAEDIWAQPIYRIQEILASEARKEEEFTEALVRSQQEWLPGLRVFEGDPSTENIAQEIGKWAQDYFSLDFMYHVEVWETAVNMAEWTG